METEINMYAKIVPELRKLNNGLTVPVVFYDDDKVMVMENLKLKEYYLKDKAIGE